MAEKNNAQQVQVDIKKSEVQDVQDAGAGNEVQDVHAAAMPESITVTLNDGTEQRTETFEYDPALDPNSQQFDQDKFRTYSADMLAQFAELQQTDPCGIAAAQDMISSAVKQMASQLEEADYASMLSQSATQSITQSDVAAAVAAALSEAEKTFANMVSSLSTVSQVAADTMKAYNESIERMSDIAGAVKGFQESFVMPAVSLADVLKDFTTNMADQIATTLQSEEFKRSLELARQNAQKLAPLLPYIQIAYKEKFPDDTVPLELDDLVMWLNADGEPVDEVADILARAKELQAADEEKQLLPAVTVQRVENIEYPLDKISGTVWRLLEKDLQGQLALKAEKSGSKKEINLYFTIDFDELAEKGITISKRLTPFDKRVYIATAAIFNAGNTVTTLKQIYSAMGYTGRPGAEDLDKINDSLTKMSRASITLDNAEEAKAYKYAKFIYDGALLPMERGSAVVNGKVVDAAIHIFREPPIVSFAKQRKQITTLDIKLLQSPVSKTDDNLLIDDYLLDRLSKAKRSSKSVKILLKTLYDHANITTAKQKQRAPAKVKRYLDYYKQCGFISKYTLAADSIIAYF